ncbi:hypothetical protein evm_012934 [Chilo suppressalis]|nr:hypothetical protein evm_012934 [Chilo suppressalis]
MVTGSDVSVAQDGGQGHVKLHPYLVALVRWCVSCVWSTATVLLHRLLAGSVPVLTIRAAGSTGSSPPRGARRGSPGTEHLHPEPRVHCEVLHVPPPQQHGCDVIFVHGLYGSLSNTWRQGDWRSKYKLEPNKVPLLRPTDCKCDNEANAKKLKEYEIDMNDAAYKDMEEKLYRGIKKILPNEEAFLAEKFYNNTLLDQIEVVDNYDTQAKFVRDLFEKENGVNCNEARPNEFENLSELNFECVSNEGGCETNEVTCKCKNGNRCEVGEGFSGVNVVADCECGVSEGKECEVGCGCVCDMCYSSCWPRDWIKEDYPNARVISINYTSDPYLWRPLWIKECKR